jgi:uncharacterized protein (TIGR02611 family)
MLRHTVRAGRVVVGLVLLLLGVVLTLPGVPGPGVLVLFGGLTLLSAEFHWARRARDGIRHMVERVTGRRHG